MGRHLRTIDKLPQDVSSPQRDLGRVRWGLHWGNLPKARVKPWLNDLHELAQSLSPQLLGRGMYEGHLPHTDFEKVLFPDLNMEGDICHHVLKLQPIPTKTPDVQYLRQWVSQLKGQWRRTFERKYSNLLGLVSGEVQFTALSVLTQYCDPPFRCFTFKDFQLALTLEEYGRLLGIPLEKSPPYLYRGHYFSWASVAKLLKVHESEVSK
ncbi:hypothetical protein CR513_47428, partial [Mucuna pruriens]